MMCDDNKLEMTMSASGLWSSIFPIVFQIIDHLVWFQAKAELVKGANPKTA